MTERKGRKTCVCGKSHSNWHSTVMLRVGEGIEQSCLMWAGGQTSLMGSCSWLGRKSSDGERDIIWEEGTLGCRWVGFWLCFVGGGGRLCFHPYSWANRSTGNFLFLNNLSEMNIHLSLWFRYRKNPLLAKNWLRLTTGISPAPNYVQKTSRLEKVDFQQLWYFPLVLSILPHFGVGRPNGRGFIPWINDSSNQFNLEPNKFS